MKKLLILLSIVFIFLSCSKTSVIEYKINKFNLPHPLNLSSMEFSSLTKYEGNIILLPENPEIHNETPKIYKINKKNIDDIIDGKKKIIEFDTITLNYNNLIPPKDQYDGFEAICFDGDDVYFVIEAKDGEKMLSYLVKGSFNKDKNDITFIKSIKIEPVINIDNSAFETIFIKNKNLYLIFEGNGKNLITTPKIVKVDNNLDKVEYIDFINIEYRITDSTSIENNGDIYLLNYIYDGDSSKYKVGKDPLFDKYGKGKTHQKYTHVERVLKLNFKNENFVISGAPYLLKLEDKARNWEGIIKLDDNIFVIITDKYPETIMGWVKIEK